MAYTCCRCKDRDDGRNLVVCIDGTDNRIGKKNTNVVRICNAIITGRDNQPTYYSSGIGTYARPTNPSLGHFRKVISSRFEAMFAWGFDKAIHDAYRWLSDTFLPGDRIYLLGFSRGAYQVRVLAGMINTVGLLYPGNHNQIPFAWEIYLSRENKKGQLYYKVPTRKYVSVHFLGVWDTVSAIGLRKRDLHLANSCENICVFRHALALDEKRVNFRPEYVEQDESTCEICKQGGPAHVKEVWFAGSHSNVGGGDQLNPDPSLDLESIPLQWMKIQAADAGIAFDDTIANNVRLHDHHFLVQRPTKSLHSWWWIPQIAFCWRPRRRASKEGQRIHFSVAFKNYNPVMKAPNQLNWSSLHHSTLSIQDHDWESLLDFDLFTPSYTHSLVMSLKADVGKELLSQLRLVTSISMRKEIMIQEDGAVTPLVELLHRDDPDKLNGDVLAILSNLAYEEAGCQKIVDTGDKIMEMLVVLLEGSSWEKAVSLLRNMAAYNCGLQKILAHKSLVPKMVGLLRQDHDVGRLEPVLGFLSNLASNEAGCIKILNTDGDIVARLVKLLDEEKTRPEAASLLRNMAYHRVGFQKVFAHKSLVPKLVGLLGQDVGRRRVVLEALANLAFLEAGCNEILNADGDIVTTLVNLLNEAEPWESAAASVLRNMAMHSVGCQKVLAHKSLVPKMVGLLDQDVGPGGFKPVLEALRNLAFNGAGSGQIVKAEGETPTGLLQDMTYYDRDEVLEGNGAGLSDLREDAETAERLLLFKVLPDNPDSDGDGSDTKALQKEKSSRHPTYGDFTWNGKLNRFQRSTTSAWIFFNERSHL